MKKTTESIFRILIVEDDRVTFTALSYLLKHYAFRVDVAETMADARKKIDDGVDAICLDLLLPDGNGIDLLREIKAKSNIPVIITTGEEDPIRLKAVLDLKPERLFEKPVDFIQMLDVIKRLADAKKPVEETKVFSLF